MKMKKHGQGKISMPADNLSGIKPAASYQNTKAPMTATIPHGKDHAKVMIAPKNLGHGKYL